MSLLTGNPVTTSDLVAVFDTIVQLTMKNPPQIAQAGGYQLTVFGAAIVLPPWVPLRGDDNGPLDGAFTGQAGGSDFTLNFNATAVNINPTG